MHNPTVTVLMSVHNGERHLRDCIESILVQTYTDFEFLIINDDSRDSTVSIVESFDDPRIRLFHNENIMGLTKSLNRGLNFSRGEYLARIDADDVSLPHRFATQVQTLAADPSLGMCASHFRVIDESGAFIGKIHPDIRGDLMVLWRLLFGNVIAHSSVMIRKDVLEEMRGYAEWAVRSQDYELWERISRRYKISMIPEVLTYWRDHDHCVSRTHNEEQSGIAEQVVHRAHTRITVSHVPMEHSVYLHDLMHKRRFRIEPITVQALKLLLNIKESFLSTYSVDMQTRNDIVTSIKETYCILLRQSMRRLSVHSFQVILYLFLKEPFSGLRTLLWFGRRAVGRALHPRRENKLSATSYERTE